MSLDIIIKTPGTKLPKLKPGQFRYVLGRDGTNLERCTEMYTSSVRVDGPIPFLEAHPQQCELHCGEIPSEMLQQMVGFFKAAYNMHGGEAALILLYYPETGTFGWYCPEQTIQMYSWWGKFYAEDTVEYDNPLNLPEGTVHFGDAHSHTGPPNPSLMDQNDEAHLDGLHIIVGYINSQRPSWHIDFCIDGNRFSVPTDVILEAIPEGPFPEPPEEWMKQIKVVYPSSYTNKTSKTSWQGGTFTTSSYSNSNGTSSYGYSGYSKSKPADDDDEEPDRYQAKLDSPKTDKNAIDEEQKDDE